MRKTIISTSISPSVSKFDHDLLSMCYDDLCSQTGGLSCWRSHFSDGCCPSWWSGCWDNIDFEDYRCDNSPLECANHCNDMFDAVCSSCAPSQKCTYRNGTKRGCDSPGHGPVNLPLQLLVLKFEHFHRHFFLPKLPSLLVVLRSRNSPSFFKTYINFK